MCLLPLGSAAEVVFQCVQPGVPVAGQRGQELLRHLHGRGAQPVAHPASLARLGGDEADLGQQRQVLADRLSGGGQAVGQVVAVAGPPPRAARIARRLGSARATNTCSAIASPSVGSGGIEVGDQVAQFARPAVVALVGRAVGVVGRLGEAGLDDGQPRSVPTGSRVNST